MISLSHSHSFMRPLPLDDKYIVKCWQLGLWYGLWVRAWPVAADQGAKLFEARQNGWYQTLWPPGHVQMRTCGGCDSIAHMLIHFGGGRFSLEVVYCGFVIGCRTCCKQIDVQWRVTFPRNLSVCCGLLNILLVVRCCSEFYNSDCRFLMVSLSFSFLGGNTW